jgi:hypothetical protein
MNSKKPKGRAAKEREKKIKLQIATQSCQNILDVFKKTKPSGNESNNENPVSIYFIILIYTFTYLM